MAMQPRDLHANRSLDKTWDLPSTADGRARSPAELLANLRLRLIQLPENHPSAPRDTNDVERSHVSCNDEREAVQRPSGIAEESSGSAGTSPDAAPGNGTPPHGGWLADFIRAVRDAHDALAESADGRVLADIEVFGGEARYEPYRPWFMSADPFRPWFAMGEDL